jgi:Protein of unknown function (DUF3226)
MLSEKLLLRESELQNYLLVEGSDDAHVFKSLLEYFQIPYEFRGQPEYNRPPKGLVKIIDKEGIDILLDTLEVELIANKEGRFGIVVDADTDLAARWQSVRNRLIDSGYSTIPEAPYPQGTIVKENERPVVGIWLMPDNEFSGMVEDFISFLVPSGDLLWPLAVDVLVKVIEKDLRFSLAHKSKALVHTWLAWQKKPGTPTGRAITNHYLDANAPHAQQLMTWIRQLFDLESA